MHNGERRTTWRHVVPLVLAFMLLGLGATPPTTSATPVTIEEFAGGVENMSLEFQSSLNNTSLVVEVPRGATILDAQFNVSGIPGVTGIFERFDFNTQKAGQGLWAKNTGGLSTIPPNINHYTVRWSHAKSYNYDAVSQSDNEYWEVVTHGESLPPPLEWPIQVYHFNPTIVGADQVVVSWEGYSECKGNLTNKFHCEMYLLDHTTSKWVRVEQYTSLFSNDFFLNHTINVTSEYFSGNGSIGVAIVGIHAEGHINPPVVISDYGHLYTDYIGVLIPRGGTTAYPENVTMTVGDVEVLNLTGPFSGSRTVGGLDGLGAALQSVIDSQLVAKGNLSIPIEFTVWANTLGLLNVTDLEITYEPIANNAPEWLGGQPDVVAEDSDWTSILDLDAVFGDDHNDMHLTFDVTMNSDPTNLDVRIRQDVVYVDHLEVLPVPDFFGEVELAMTAWDLFDVGTVSPPITVIVEQRADAPVLVPTGELTVEEGSTIDIVIGVDDPDLPDDILAFNDSSDYLDIDPATGTISWTPDEHQVGNHTFSVSVVDRFGLTDSILVTIGVANVNNIPTIVSELTTDAVQDVPGTYQILADDPDIPQGDQLTYYALSEDVIVGCDAFTGVVTFTPTNENVPLMTVTLGVMDMLKARYEVDLVVNVENVNDAPTWGAFMPADLLQGEPVDVLLPFTDPDLTITIPVPEALTFTFEGPEAFAVDAEGRVRLVPGQDLVGTHMVTYTVTDDAGLTDSITVVWTVLDVNDVPQIVTLVPDPLEATEDVEFTLALEAVDVDGDTLEWMDNSDIFDIDPVTGIITFTPLQENVGQHEVTIRVTDGRDGSATIVIHITVAEVNDAPVINDIAHPSGTTVRIGERVTLEANATDEEGDVLTYTWFLDDGELGTGSVLVVDDLPEGTQAIRLVVSDGTSSDEAELVLEVEGDGPGISPGTTLAIIAVVVVVSVAAVLAIRRNRGGGFALMAA